MDKKKLLTFSPTQWEIIENAAIAEGYARQSKKRVYGVEAYIHYLLSQQLLTYPSSDRRRNLNMSDD